VIEFVLRVVAEKFIKVRRCRFTVSNPVLKAPTVSALETGISLSACNVCFQLNLRRHIKGENKKMFMGIKLPFT